MFWLALRIKQGNAFEKQQKKGTTVSHASQKLDNSGFCGREVRETKSFKLGYLKSQKKKNVKSKFFLERSLL